MSASYIPAADASFNSWLINFDALVTADGLSWDLTAPQIAALAAATTAYSAALTLATDPGTRTPATIAAKNTAKATALATARPIAQFLNASTLVTDEDRAALGLTIRKTTPTPITAPTTFPLLDILLGTPGQHKIQWRDSETPLSKAKPFGALQMELWTSVGTITAPDPSDANFHSLQTKSPFFVDLDVADTGKVITYFARWVTRTGIVGPWSSGVSLTATF